MVGNRIKKVRTSLGLTQVNFGERLGVSRDVINNAELERATISPLLIKAVALEFAVNENWLVNGTGEMFINSNGNLLELLKSEYKLSNFEFKILKTYLELDVNQRKAVENFAHKIFSSEPDSVTAKDNSHLEIVYDDKAIGKEVGSIDTLLNGSYIINLNIIPKKRVILVLYMFFVNSFIKSHKLTKNILYNYFFRIQITKMF